MIELAVLNATLLKDSERVDLPPREFAVLITLALAPRVWPSYRLIPLLWPGASPSASSCLKVYVHRLRRRLGKDVIMSTNRGYELARSVRVDLWAAEELLRKPVLSATELETLHRIAVDGRGPNRDFLSRWGWFAQSEALIQEALDAISSRLEHESRPAGPVPERHMWAPARSVRAAV